MENAISNDSINSYVVANAITPVKKAIVLISSYNDLFEPYMEVIPIKLDEFKFKYILDNCLTEEINDRGVKYLMIVKAGNKTQKVRMPRITTIIK